MLNLKRYQKYKNLLTKKYLFVLLVFLVPMLLRAVPEFLMGPYLVGFDTLAHYVPTTHLWLEGNVDIYSFIATAPLFYSLVAFLSFAGCPLLIILKILPPLLHGLLGLSIFGYAKSALNWSAKKSALTSLIATVFFVALRVSWDMLRNQLALIFLFIVLTILSQQESKQKTWKQTLLLVLGMVAVVLSHQIVSLMMFGILFLTLIRFLIKKHYSNTRYLLLASFIPLLLFLAVIFLSPTIPEYRIIFGFSNFDGWLELFGFPSYLAMLFSQAGFFLYCFIPILPFVVVSIKRFRNFYIRAWIFFIFIALLLPIVSPSNLRWILLLVYPFAFYVTETLSWIQTWNWKPLNRLLQIFIILYLVFSTGYLSSGFILNTPENPSPYFDPSIHNSYIFHIPSSMLQNTVSITDCSNTQHALQYFAKTLGNNQETVLLSHRVFYGWAFLTSLNIQQVLLYEYDNPITAVEHALNKNYTQIYLVWWVNGEGWYGQPTVPKEFTQIYQKGAIAIYQYTQPKNLNP